MILIISLKKPKKNSKITNYLINYNPSLNEILADTFYSWFHELKQYLGQLIKLMHQRVDTRVEPL